MYKKQSHILMSFVLCFSFSSIKCMNRTNEQRLTWREQLMCVFFGMQESFCLRADQQSDQKKGLWVTSIDNHNICIPEEVVRYCSRLKLAPRLYPDRCNEQNPLPVRFTADELYIFVDMMTKTNEIMPDESTKKLGAELLNVIISAMPIADSFGAYLLYSLCVSRYMQHHDVSIIDIEKDLIVSLLEKIKSPVRIAFDKYGNHDSAVCTVKDWMDEPVQGFFIKNNDYFIEEKRKETNPFDHNTPIEDFHSPYYVYDKQGQVIHTFESYSNSGIQVSPYLFKDKNILLYYTQQDKYGTPQLHIYDIDNKREKKSFSFDYFVISDDEKYLATTLNNRLYLYNCTDIDDIKEKIIDLNLYSYAFKFSPDGTKLCFQKKIEQQDGGKYGLFLCNINDIDWGNESLPTEMKVYSLQEILHDVAWGIDSNTLLFEENKVWKSVCVKNDTPLYREYENKTPIGYTSLSSGVEFFISKMYNGKEDKTSVTIYHMDNISKPLYSYKGHGKLDYKFPPTSPLNLIICNDYYSKNVGFLMLRYDKEKRCFHQLTDMMLGNVGCISSAGFFTAGSDKSYDQRITYFFDNCGKKLVEMSSGDKRLGAPQFSCRQDRCTVHFDTVEEPSKRLCCSVPISYLKPTGYYSDLDCSKMMLLMGVRNKIDTFHSVCQGDVVDAVLKRFGEKKDEVQKMLGIEYKK